MTEINIDINKIHNEISPILYGIFFEDINYAGDGGLYAELIANRSFAYFDPSGRTDLHTLNWETVGNAVLKISTEKPLNNVNTHYASVSGAPGSGIKNIGFCGEGIAVRKNEAFRFSLIAGAASPCPLTIRIKGSDNQVLAAVQLSLTEPEWTKYEFSLTTNAACPNAYPEILLTNGGTADFALISLFPADTYKGHKNGLRKDIAQFLADLKPGFVRFPGGCIVEGRSFDTMYRWKDTIGDIAQRRTNVNRWQMEEYQPEGRTAHDYFQSYGLGYLEYFQFCEDIGAKPVPVMNCGMTCQWHEGLLAELDKLDPWIQDIYDLIEFANGDETSEWGKKRILLGHEKPFGLEYIGIGNEQWGTEYFERYEIFQKKISKRYPKIRLITCAGYAPDGYRFDLAMEWMRENKSKAYAADEHFYKPPEWFLDNIHRYDSYDRTLPKVFAGEYAAHTSREISERRNNWKSALSEAAFLTGVERNADHVVMTCYAPLLARTNHQQWQPNLIWFNNESVYGTPNYYVQKLFSTHVGSRLIDAVCEDGDIKTAVSVTDDNRLIIKLVNLSEREKQISLGTGKHTSGKVYELYAALDAENSHETPCNIYPVMTELKQFDGRFRLKGSSVTIFTLAQPK